jgi:hypothetical protein
MYLVGFIALWGVACIVFVVVWVLRSTRAGIRAHIATLPYSPPDRIPDGQTVVGVAPVLTTSRDGALTTVSMDKEPTRPLQAPHDPRHLVGRQAHRVRDYRPGRR